MRKLAFAAIIVLLAAGIIFIYAEWEKKHFTENLPKPPANMESPDTSSEEEPSSTLEVPPASQHQGTPEQLEQDSETTSGQLTTEEDDWPTVPHPYRHGHARTPDPGRNENTATQETSEAMSDDELWDRDLNQLIERFGDIPEVHAYLEYDRRVRTGQHITLEEDIAFLEAMQFLFPNEATRKTILLKKWELKNGFILPTAADLEYFKSEGITVLYHEDGSLKKITTKY